jgi:PAS domain S-box-containing protein
LKETKQPVWLVLVRLVTLTLLYVLAGVVGRKTAGFMDGYALVWPPAGIALAGILLFGYAYWPAIMVGSLLFSGLNHVPVGYFMAATAVGNTLGAIVCVYLLRTFLKFDNAMSRTIDAVGYLVFACGLGTTVNAISNAVGLLNDRKIAPDQMFDRIMEWWVPNALAALVLTPVLICWYAPSPFKLTFWRRIEGLLYALGLAGATLLAFNTWFVYGLQEYPLAYLPCPFLVWGALRFGTRGAATGTMVVAGLAIYSLYLGRGPFFTGNESHGLRLLGSFVAIVAASNLLLAAAATERRRALAEIVANEKRLRLVVSDQQELICRFTPDGKLTFVNSAYCAFYSREEKELLGTNFFKTLEPPEAETLQSNLAELPDERPVCIFDRRSIGGDGHAEWHQYNIRRLNRTGLAETEFQAVIQNISARKRVEFELQEAKTKLEQLNTQLQISAKQARDAADEANRASLAKSEFLTNMSHELRTPLSGILGMVELLGQTRLDARQRELADSATHSANSLLHVINDILDFSKIETGKLAVTREEFSIRSVVDGVLENAAMHEPAKKINLAAIVRHDVPQRLIGDPIRLRQVLLHLVANGIKFTEAGEVVLRVHPLYYSDGRARLRFEVADTGIGLTPEQSKQLFQPFTQVDSSSSRRFGGIGLGLAISRKIVELMEGQIGVYSNPDKGATFWFEIFFEVPVQPPVERGFPGLVFCRVLVAAPNASLRESLSERLRGWGIECLASARLGELSRDIQASLESSILPLVLCDDEMLVLGGEALREQLARNRDRVKSILLAGPAAITDGQEGDLTLFTKVLLKPVREQPFFETLVGIVGGQEQESPGPIRLPGDTRDTQVIRREAAAARHTPISKLRILAAEDHPFNRRLCQMMLDTFGATAEWAVNGREAVDKFRPGQFDAILMDCNMPEMDGNEATAAIRHIEMENHVQNPVRIIAITANAVAGERERCLAAGMDDYIAKPYTSQQLYQALLAAVPLRPEAAGFFDPDRLEQLTRELNRVAVNEMVSDFLAELPDRLTEIHRLHAGAHWPSLKRSAHSLKGLLVVFGFPELSDQFLALEEAAALADEPGVAKFMDGLDGQVDEVARHLRKWLKN